jgi:hypothetical protein
MKNRIVLVINPIAGDTDKKPIVNAVEQMCGTI